MGRLYDDCQYVMRTIEKQGLDVFKSRGAIALETGFLISAISERDSDDPEKIESLRRAAREILQIEIPA